MWYPFLFTCLFVSAFGQQWYGGQKTISNVQRSAYKSPMVRFEQKTVSQPMYQKPITRYEQKTFTPQKSTYAVKTLPKSMGLYIRKEIQYPTKTAAQPKRFFVSSFSCQDKGYGYYADVANGCVKFHVCSVLPKEDGGILMRRFDFECPATTRFDQNLLTCVTEPQAMDCLQSERLFANTAARFAGPVGYSSKTYVSPQQRLTQKEYGKTITRTKFFPQQGYGKTITRTEAVPQQGYGKTITRTEVVPQQGYGKTITRMVTKTRAEGFKRLPISKTRPDISPTPITYGTKGGVKGKPTLVATVRGVKSPVQVSTELKAGFLPPSPAARSAALSFNPVPLEENLHFEEPEPEEF